MVPSVYRSRQGKYRQKEQELKVEPVQLTVELRQVPKNPLVRHPKSSDDKETENVTQKRGGLLSDRIHDLAVRASITQLSNIEPEDEERQDDGKHAIAQRANSRRIRSLIP
jgi:hypothetical protein